MAAIAITRSLQEGSRNARGPNDRGWFALRAPPLLVWLVVAAATTIPVHAGTSQGDPPPQNSPGPMHGPTLADSDRAPVRGDFPALIQDGDAVFFVGNSFFGWQDRKLAEWVSALGKAVSPPIRIGTGSDILFGNTPLAGFLGHPATQAALASRKFEVFVLQGEEFEPVDHKAAFHQAVRDFHRAITAAGGRTVLFMTWDFRWRPFIAELAASYDEIGRELGIPVIPAGLIYRDCGRAPPHGETSYWLTASTEHPDGDLHENEKGTAVNAYATFAMLTGRNPLGTNFAAPGNTNDDALMRYFSDMAWAEVRLRLK